MAFPKRLAELRKEKGWTQAELAKLINVSQPSVADYERGKKIPFKNTQIQIARVFKISVDELMKDDERSV